jgi:hypothetical protein
MIVRDKRRAPRVDVTVPCALRRRTGSPIPAETLNLGPGGMLVRSPRPLRVDEALDIDLADLDMRIVGAARVMRHEGHREYALRFEGLPQAMLEHLRALTLSAA